MRPQFIFILCSATLLSGNEFLTVDQIIPGQNVLGITLHDSIPTPDLSQIYVEGYEVENAVFVQENDPNLPTLIREYVVDFAALPDFQVINFQPELNTVTVQSPLGHDWVPGHIICDTSFHGLSQKVLQVEDAVANYGTIVWRLKTIPVPIQEVVTQCDVSFISQPNLSFTLPDSQWVENVIGMHLNMPGNEMLQTELGIALNNFHINVKPQIRGRLRIYQGVIEIQQFQINGPCEIHAQVHLMNTHPGKFSFSGVLPITASHPIPLGAGLFVRLSYGAEISLNLESQNEFFQTDLQLNLRGDLHSELAYQNGTWQSLSSWIDLVHYPNPETEQGLNAAFPGNAEFAIVPKFEMRWTGGSGLAVKMKTFNQVHQTRNYLASLNRTLEIGVEAKARTFQFPDSAQLAYHDSLLLGNVERVISTPPIQIPMVEIRETGADSIILDWLHSPEVQSYFIQAFLNDSLKTIDSIMAPPVVIPNLQENTEYIFRIVPRNPMGIGIPGMVTCRTKIRRFPPEIPQLISPFNDSTLGDPAVTLSWISRDPDSVDEIAYTLYLDTVNPPSGLIFTAHKDTSYVFRSLLPDKQYFWRVDASDGFHYVMGQMWSFKTPPAVKQEFFQKKEPEPPRDNVVYIPAGNFVRSDGRKVMLAPFFIHKYEVTQKEFYEIMEKNPSYRQGDSLPVESVNWNDAASFCRELDGRLPTEAEWEYAARGETQSDYYWGKGSIEDHAWYHANSNNRTHPIGKKKPNAWGLHDMSGNVFEWVQDWYGAYSSTVLENPAGVESGKARVTRGGSWYSDAASLKSGARFMNRPAFSSFKLGFRCVFPIKEPSAPSTAKAP
jgi:hypothetical protein